VSVAARQYTRQAFTPNLHEIAAFAKAIHKEDWQNKNIFQTYSTNGYDGSGLIKFKTLERKLKENPLLNVVMALGDTQKVWSTQNSRFRLEIADQDFIRVDLDETSCSSTEDVKELCIAKTGRTPAIVVQTSLNRFHIVFVIKDFELSDKIHHSLCLLLGADMIGSKSVVKVPGSVSKEKYICHATAFKDFSRISYGSLSSSITPLLGIENVPEEHTAPQTNSVKTTTKNASQEVELGPQQQLQNNYKPLNIRKIASQLNKSKVSGVLVGHKSQASFLANYYSNLQRGRSTDFSITAIQKAFSITRRNADKLRKEWEAKGIIERDGSLWILGKPNPLFQYKAGAVLADKAPKVTQTSLMELLSYLENERPLEHGQVDANCGSWVMRLAHFGLSDEAIVWVLETRNKGNRRRFTRQVAHTMKKFQGRKDRNITPEQAREQLQSSRAQVTAVSKEEVAQETEASEPTQPVSNRFSIPEEIVARMDRLHKSSAEVAEYIPKTARQVFRVAFRHTLEDYIPSIEFHRLQQRCRYVIKRMCTREAQTHVAGLIAVELVTAACCVDFNGPIFSECVDIVMKEIS
jgi:DNA-binding transcriptional MerR regulator